MHLIFQLPQLFRHYDGPAYIQTAQECQVSAACHVLTGHRHYWDVQCESKKIPLTVFWNFFPNGMEF